METLSVLTTAEMENYVARFGRKLRPRPPYHLHFPRGLVEHAAHYLQLSGAVPLEQLVLFGGYPTDQGVAIASLLMPETEATWGWVHVLPKEQPLIAEWLRDHGQLLFVESHTHGSGPMATEISPEDRRHPASRQEGFLTIIVPDYALNGIDFLRTGVWECIQREWERMDALQVRQRLHLVADEEVRRALAA